MAAKQRIQRTEPNPLRPHLDCVREVAENNGVRGWSDPFLNENEGLKSCLARHGYSISRSVEGYATLVLRARRIVTRGNYEHNLAWLMRRNRKLSALGLMAVPS
jgi:hypothetical protein